MAISKLQNRGHMDKRAVESAIEGWSNDQIAALIVSASRLLQLRLESRASSPQSEWSTVTSVAPGGKGSASSWCSCSLHRVCLPKNTKDWERGSRGLLCATLVACTVNRLAHGTNGITRITGVIATGGCDAG